MLTLEPSVRNMVVANNKSAVHEADNRRSVCVVDDIQRGVGLVETKDHRIGDFQCIGEDDPVNATVGNDYGGLPSMSAEQEFLESEDAHFNVGKAFALGKFDFGGTFHPNSVLLRVESLDLIVSEAFETAKVDLAQVRANDAWKAQKRSGDGRAFRRSLQGT